VDLPSLCVKHRGRAAVFDQHLVDHGARYDGEIGPSLRRLKKSPCRAPSTSPAQ
jgi:hypothetical protein